MSNMYGKGYQRLKGWIVTIFQHWRISFCGKPWTRLRMLCRSYRVIMVLPEARWNQKSIKPYRCCGAEMICYWKLVRAFFKFDLIFACISASFVQFFDIGLRLKLLKSPFPSRGNEAKSTDRTHEQKETFSAETLCSILTGLSKGSGFKMVRHGSAYQ